MIQLNAPEFSASVMVAGTRDVDEMKLSDYLGKWVILFYFPLSFTFVCPTEIISFSDRQQEFSALNCQVIGASCDSTQTHIAWSNTPRVNGGLGEMKIPIISDFSKEIAKAYGVLLPDGTPLRGTFIISPAGIVRHVSINDLPVGRNVDEYVRLVAAFQHTDEFGELCPANWQPGDNTIKPNSKDALNYFSSSGPDQHAPGNEYTKVLLSTTSRRSNHLTDSDSSSLSCAKFTFSKTLKNMQKLVFGVLDAYKGALQSAPLQTKALSSLVIALLGELIAASIKAQKTKSKKVIVDFRRIAIFGVYGLAIAGPFFHWWYGYLERTVAKMHLNPPFLSFATKLATNQLIMTPPVLLFTLCYIQYFLTLDAKKTIETVKRTYAVALFTNWKVWTAAQAINFQVVPLDYRVLFGNVVALWWNTYLSVTSQ